MFCSSACSSAWSSWCSVFSSSACSSSSVFSSLGWLFSVGLSAQGCAKAPLDAAAAAWLCHLSHPQPTSSNPAERNELQSRHKRRIAATHLVAAPPLQSCEPGPHSRTYKQRRCGGAASRVRGRGRPLRVALGRNTALCGGRGRYIRVSIAPPGLPPRTLGLWRNSRRSGGCREPELVWGREMSHLPALAFASGHQRPNSVAILRLYGSLHVAPVRQFVAGGIRFLAGRCVALPTTPSSEIENGKRAGKRNKPRSRPAPPHAHPRSRHLPPDPPAAPPPRSLR